MKNIRNLILAVLLTFMAISLLTAALQYSTDLIGVMVQNETMMPTEVKVSGSSNSTGDNSPDSSGALSAYSPLGGFNMSSLGLNGGGDTQKPDPEDHPNYLLIVLAILVVLVLLAFIGYIVWRRRRRGQTVPATPEQAIAAAVLPGSFEGDYKIRFPQIREPFPAIWGEGEALEFTIERKEGAPDEAVLDIDGKVVRDIVLEDGKAQARLDLEKGSHRITVSAKNSATGPSWAEVWVVDYREEVVRMFNEMYLNYSSRYNGIEDKMRGDAKMGGETKMTPRELERTIGPEMPETNRKALDVAVTIFEFANYSLHAIRRREFEKMYLSKIDVAREA